jgi:hypothetical protein
VGNSSDVENTASVLPTESGRSRREAERCRDRGEEKARRVGDKWKRRQEDEERVYNLLSDSPCPRCLRRSNKWLTFFFLNAIKCALQCPNHVDENFNMSEAYDDKQ